MIRLLDIYTPSYIHVQAPRGNRNEVVRIVLPERIQTAEAGGREVIFIVPSSESETFGKCLRGMAGTTRLELATSAVTA
jgi:hypothetical protein